MIFIKPGDNPLSVIQATTRGTQIVAQQLGKAGARAGDETIFAATAHADLPQRLLDVLARLDPPEDDPEAGPPATYSEFAARWEVSNETNAANNSFNHKLAAYRKYSARLARYRLADGREEVTEEIETGEFDEEGNAITELVIVQEAIEPLPAEVEQSVYDEETEQTSTVMVVNPLIVQDDAGRAVAQETIDAIPQDVIDFYDAQQAAQ